jgi:hypothetical protein
MSGGKQVNINGITGGMLYDIDPMRISPKAFSRLVNLQYNKIGYLERVFGSEAATFAPPGSVIGIERVNKDQGYLVSAYKLHYVSSLGDGTGDTVFGTHCMSKVVPSNYGYYYYLDSEGMSKWRRVNNTNEKYSAGVEVPADRLNPVKYAASVNPWRITAKSATDDSTMVVNATSTAGTQISRPYSVGSGSGTTNPANAMDGDDSTYSETYGSVTYYGINNHDDSTTNKVLTIKWAINEIDNGPCYVRYSLDGGETWTTISSSTGGPTTTTVNLTDDQDLTLIRVYGFASGIDEGNEGDGTFERSYVRFYDIKVTGQLAGVNGAYLKIYLAGDNPSVLTKEGFKRIYIPIRSNTLSSSVSFDVTIEETNLATGKVSQTETVGVTLGAASTAIDVTFTGTYYICGDGEKSTVITVKYNDVDSVDLITFYRADPWLVKNSGRVEVYTNAVTTYTDREPLMGFKLEGSLSAGEYEYASCFEDDCGFTSNPSSLKKITLEAGDIVAISFRDMLDAISVAESLDSLESYVLARSMVGGGGLYELAKYTHAQVSSQVSLRYNPAAFNGIAGTNTFFAPNTLIDTRQIPSGVAIQESHDTPSGLNFSERVLVKFRQRLWGIANLEDTAGITHTFIRYSDVDIFDYWDPLNEISIPDEIIDLCPLREDMMLAFSRTRTYRIFPEGSGFTWLKIADQGIGGVGMCIGTNDAIFWYNLNGMWVFDGASVTLSKSSLANLSLIRELIESSASVSRVERRNQIIFGTYTDGIWGEVGLIYDYFIRAFTMVTFPARINSIIELDGKPDTEIWYGSDDLLYQEKTHFKDGAVNKTALIKLKRLAARELDRIRLFYLSIKLGQIAGVTDSFKVYADFTNGRSIEKVCNLVKSTKDHLVVTKEIYGEDEWIDLEIIHENDSQIQFREFTVGASTADLKFPEEVANA